MTTTDARHPLDERMRRLFHTLFVEKDLDTVAAELWTEQTTNDMVALGIEIHGATALRAFFTEFLAAVPDVALEIEDVVATDGNAVVRWTISGTFTGGPFQGVDPTGAAVRIRGIDHFLLDDNGKVIRNTVYYDGLAFARQVGLLPPEGGAADRAMLAAFNAKTRVRDALKSRLAN